MHEVEGCSGGAAGPLHGGRGRREWLAGFAGRVTPSRLATRPAGPPIAFALTLACTGRALRAAHSVQQWSNRAASGARHRRGARRWWTWRNSCRWCARLVVPRPPVPALATAWRTGSSARGSQGYAPGHCCASSRPAAPHTGLHDRQAAAAPVTPRGTRLREPAPAPPALLDHWAAASLHAARCTPPPHALTPLARCSSTADCPQRAATSRLPGFARMTYTLTPPPRLPCNTPAQQSVGRHQQAHRPALLMHTCNARLHGSCCAPRPHRCARR